MATGVRQKPQMASRSMSTGAPQLPQLTWRMCWRSSAISDSESGRTKSFARRNWYDVMNRPCPAGQRWYQKRVFRCRSCVSTSGLAQRGHASDGSSGVRRPASSFANSLNSLNGRCRRELQQFLVVEPDGQAAAAEIDRQRPLAVQAFGLVRRHRFPAVRTVHRRAPRPIRGGYSITRGIMRHDHAHLPIRLHRSSSPSRSACRRRPAGRRQGAAQGIIAAAGRPDAEGAQGHPRGARARLAAGGPARGRQAGVARRSARAGRWASPTRR